MARELDREERIPPIIKLLYTAFYIGIVYLTVNNFNVLSLFWFSQTALFIVLIGMWAESRILISMASLSILIFHSIWTIGFFIRLIFGITATGGLAYMFDPQISPILRYMSLYHVVLPLLILWILKRKGYDPRAFKLQTLLAWIIFIATFLFTPMERNINWVFGPQSPQTLISPYLYLAIVMVTIPVFIYFPTHVVLKHVFPVRKVQDK